MTLTIFGAFVPFLRRSVKVSLLPFPVGERNVTLMCLPALLAIRDSTLDTDIVKNPSSTPAKHIPPTANELSPAKADSAAKESIARTLQ